VFVSAALPEPIKTPVSNIASALSNLVRYRCISQIATHRRHVTAGGTVFVSAALPEPIKTPVSNIASALSNLVRYRCISQITTPGVLIYCPQLYLLRPSLWSSGQSSWLQIHRSRVRFPTLQNFLRSSGSVTGPTQPREDN
jgi:hypothetical protein